LHWHASDVLIVDDQETTLNVLHDLIAAQCPVARIVTYANPRDALAWAHGNDADLVLVDYRMPEMDGIQFLLALRSLAAYDDVPIIVVTAVNERMVRLEALGAGATDFVCKPVDPAEFQARCQNLLTLRHQSKLLHDKNRSLEGAVHEAMESVLLREKETLRRLAKAGEYRDEETGFHLDRMARYSRIIAEAAGIPEADCETLELAAPMHDIGKIGIPDAILLKPGRHDDKERFIMRQHTVVGYDILKGSPSRYLQAGAVIALGHHERYDGTGYPNGLHGEEIPVFSRIVAIADVFDALTSKRPYKEAWPFDKALDYVSAERGTHFDPRLADAFLSRITRVREIYETYRDLETQGPELRQIR
jgi:two-component system response regulator RpfG